MPAPASAQPAPEVPSPAATGPVSPPLSFSGAVGHLILSADRLIGVSSWSTASSFDEGGLHFEPEDSGTMVNLLWANSATGIADVNMNPFAMPRLALDSFVGPNVTFGASIGYVSTTGSTKRPFVTGSGSGIGSGPNNVQYQTNDLPEVTGFALEPRLGVSIPVGEHNALWLRGGITYFHSTWEKTESVTDINGTGSTTTTSVNTQITVNATALSFDPVLVLMPVPHVGITLGPTIDIGLDGSSEVSITPNPLKLTSRPIDVKMSAYGAAGGILVFF
jgi:hypothetical protein